MDKDAARVRLSNMVAADARPSLSEADLDALLDLARRPDAMGRGITEPDWQPTWNLNAAAAEGWRWKAARCAGDFTFSADGASFDKGAVMEKCLAMEAKYAGLDYGTLATEAAPGQPLYDSPRLIL